MAYEYSNYIAPPSISPSLKEAKRAKKEEAKLKRIAERIKYYEQILRQQQQQEAMAQDVEDVDFSE